MITFESIIIYCSNLYLCIYSNTTKRRLGIRGTYLPLYKVSLFTVVHVNAILVCNPQILHNVALVSEDRILTKWQIRPSNTQVTIKYCIWLLPQRNNIFQSTKSVAFTVDCQWSPSYRIRYADPFIGLMLGQCRRRWYPFLVGLLNLRRIELQTVTTTSYSGLLLRGPILVHVTIYRRLRIGRDGHLDQSEAYDIS